MSAIVGLSTNILKSLYLSDLMYTLDAKATKELQENNLLGYTPIDIVGDVLENVDQTLTASFLKELESTINANTRILLLEGVNPNYNALVSLEALNTIITNLLPHYQKSEDSVYEKLLDCQSLAQQTLEYIKKYVMFDFGYETAEEKQYAILKDFDKHSTVIKELSTVYTPAVARVHKFRIDAKKSIKTSKEKGAKSIKHTFIIPQDFSEVVELDISLKYITLAASLLEYSAPSTRLTLLQLFMMIERLSVVSMSQILKVDAETVRTFDMEDIRLAMYNLILVCAMDSFTMNNPYSKDTLDIPVEQLRTQMDIDTGYCLDRFVTFEKDLLTEDEETVKTLVNWWRFYAYYQPILFKNTEIAGITPELHKEFGYDRKPVNVKYPNGQVLQEVHQNPYRVEHKFNELVRFAVNMIANSQQIGIHMPTSRSCNIILNPMVKALAKGQVGERKQVNYKQTLVKPADVIINNVRENATAMKTKINQILNIVNNSSAITPETYDYLSGLLPWANVVDTIVNTKDASLVPDNVEEWAVVNNLGLDMQQICLDRQAMLHAREFIQEVHRKNKYRIDVFDDSKLGVKDGMTIYSQSKAKEPETLYNYAVTSDEYGNKSPNLQITQRYVSLALKEVKHITNVLNKRLDLINTYEDDAEAKLDFRPLKIIYSSMISALIADLDQSSTTISDALTFHYGHSELNKSVTDFKAREGRLEPVIIEQSRTKPMLEGTIDRHRNWYMKLESREFMLSCLVNDGLDANYMKTPVW